MSPPVRQLLNELRDGNSRVRRAALHSLGGCSWGDQVKRAVIKLFRTDNHGQNRLCALTVLSRAWPEPDVVDLFAEAIEGELFIAERAVTILGDIADDRAFHLLETAYLTTRNVWVRITVLNVYDRAPQARLHVFLKKTGVLACAEDNVRATAVSMLRRVANPTLARIFLHMLHDKCDRVRANAVEGLGSCLTSDRLVPILLPLARDGNNRVRANALVLLLKAGFRRVERFLDDMAASANELFRASAAYVIGELPFAPKRRDLLGRLLDDESDMVASQAERALEKQLLLA